MWGKTGSKLYGSRSGSDYIDNHKRFTLFCKAAIESVRALPFGPGEDCVFVANDWHSGLVPVLIKVCLPITHHFLLSSHLHEQHGLQQVWLGASLGVLYC